jgi:hypothetical protein
LSSPNVAAAKFSALAAKPDARSPKPAGQSANPGITVLQVRLDNITKATLVVWMVPLPEGQNPPSAFPPIEPLESLGVNGIAEFPGVKQPRLILSSLGTGWKVGVRETGPVRLDLCDPRGACPQSVKGIGPFEWEPDLSRAPSRAYLVLRGAGAHPYALPLPYGAPGR